MTLKRRSLLRAAWATAVIAAAMPLLPQAAGAQARIRVGILDDIANFDPHQFSFVNAVLIKNLYDSLLEYTPDGKVQPSLATAYQIAPDSKSVTLTLRQGVKFHSGNPFNAEAVAANLKKAADPKLGKNVFPTMSFVQDWTVVDANTIRLDFKGPAPERQPEIDRESSEGAQHDRLGEGQALPP